MNRFDRLQSEFPDYDIATLPPIPAGWEDSSWHNDVCPSFTIGDTAGAFLHVFVDYQNPDERELGDFRFCVSAVDKDGDSGHIIDSDDWQAILDTVNRETNNGA